MTQTKTNPLRTNYAMFSLAGNSKVRSLVAGLRKSLEVGILTNADEVLKALTKGLDAIDKAGYPEAWDTAVRDVIWADLLAICKNHGITEEDFYN